MSGASDVPVLSNGIHTSEAAADQLRRSGVRSEKQRRFLIALDYAGSYGMTVGDFRNHDDSRYHHGSSSGLLSTLHSRGLIVALTETREGQTVYVLPEYVNGRETRPYRAKTRRASEGKIADILIDNLGGVIEKDRLRQIAHEIAKAT